MTAKSSVAWRVVRRRDGCRYVNLQAMQRTDFAPFHARFPQGAANAWLARRWYYTPRSHRAYSVRQISPGDRRLLAEFALTLGQNEVRGHKADRDPSGLQALNVLLFDRVMASGSDNAVGFAALENTAAGDRVIGVAAYAPTGDDSASFNLAVAPTHREEQVGRVLLSTLLLHAKRVCVPRLVAEMHWSNRPMQMLALSMGFTVEPAPHDRNMRRLVLALK
jgi:GNAT superfamily N-acetyltransferase